MYKSIHTRGKLAPFNTYHSLTPVPPGIDVFPIYEKNAGLLKNLSNQDREDKGLSWHDYSYKYKDFSYRITFKMHDPFLYKIRTLLITFFFMSCSLVVHAQDNKGTKKDTTILNDNPTPK